MVNEVKYGVISDVHGDPRVIDVALERLRSEGIDSLVLNGDIGGGVRETAYIFNQVGLSGIETYTQPGSHETIEGYHGPLKHFSDQFSTIHDVYENRKIEKGNHDLVFLPGSDFLCGGEYQFGNSKERQTGLYENRDENYSSEFFRNRQSPRKSTTSFF
jgi:hypothetical protein